MPPSTVRIVGLLIFWMFLSVPMALHAAATARTSCSNNFLKTAVMSFVVAASVRSARDVERLALVYLVGAVVYTGVVITRFDLGSGPAWRLSHLYYYDANDFATLTVTAMPLALHFLDCGDGASPVCSRRLGSCC